MKGWRTYQNETAEFFRTLGFDATVEALVNGARGKHKIDVLVEFNHAGVRTRWIVECKYWKSSVPKEKVLALQSIAQDIGADRAFLLSERGFQSGAIRVAQHTNVTLTNLQDLRDNAKDYSLQAKLASVAKRYSVVNKPVSEFLITADGRPGSPPGTKFDDVLEIAADLFLLRIGLPQALAGQFPLSLAGASSHVEHEHVQVHHVAEFIERAEKILDSAEQRMTVQRQRADEATKLIEENFREFKAAVHQLFDLAEIALIQSPNSEQARRDALAGMRRTGSAAEALRDVADGRIATRLGSTMRALIDSVYLHLTHPSISGETWLSVCDRVALELEALEHVVTVGPAS
jgi:hypothetical protein